MPTPPKRRVDPLSACTKGFRKPQVAVDADARVAHFDHHPVGVVHRARPDDDRAALRRVFDGVVDQMAEDGVEGLAVTADQRKVPARRHLDGVALRHRGETCHRVPDGVGQLARPDGDLEGPCLHPASHQDPFDQPVEVVGPPLVGRQRFVALVRRHGTPVMPQGAGQAPHDGERALQLMAGGGKEEGLGFIQRVLIGEVAQEPEFAAPFRQVGLHHLEPALTPVCTRDGPGLAFGSILEERG